MPNQSSIAIPPNVDEPVVLRRFLQRLVEQLDVIQGNRAGETAKYVSQQELVELTQNLLTEISIAKESLDFLLSTLEDLSRTEASELGARISVLEEAVATLQTESNNLNLRVTAIENAGYIADAPVDGNTYARKDGAWVIIP